MIAEAEIPHEFHIHRNSIKQESLTETQADLPKKIIAGAEQQDYPVVSIVRGMNFVMAQLSSLAELARVGPAIAELPSIESFLDPGWTEGFVGTYFFVVLDTSAENVTNVRARMIDYKVGEDPATGSAACSLACYLSHKAALSERVHAFEIEQGIEMGRPSSIRVKVELDSEGNIKRVFLSGSAVKVMEGKVVV